MGREEKRTGFAGGVETEHEQAHLSGSEDLAHYLGDLTSHCSGWRKVEPRRAGVVGLLDPGRMLLHRTMWCHKLVL